MASTPEREDPSAADASLLASAWGGLEGEIAQERGIAGRLKRWPTNARRALALAITLAFPTIAIALAPREDLGSVSVAHALVWGLVLSALAVAGTLVATRPLQARALEGSVVPALAAGAALAAGVLVLVPMGAGGPADPEGHGPGACAMASTVVGALTFLLVRALRRDAIGAALGAALVAAATALATAALACPVDALAHLAPGHALPAVLVIAVGVMVDRLGRAAT